MLRNLGALAEAVKNSSVPRDTVTLVSGQIAPTLVLRSLDGALLSTSDLQGQPTTYAIVSPSCGPCQMFVESLNNGMAQDVFPNSVRRVFISTGSIEETRESLGGELPSDVITFVDRNKQTAESWGVRSTPTFVSLDARGHYQAHTVGFEPPPTMPRQQVFHSKVHPQLH